MTFKPDMGADCNAMSAQTLNALDVSGRFRVSNSKLVAFFGQKITPLRRRALTCEYKGQKHRNNQGLWQIKRDNESSKLYTFNTPMGRYRFLRLSFGISSAFIRSRVLLRR